jgi:hypothetical protein
LFGILSTNKTFLTKYGVTNPFKSEIFKQKSREKSLLKWGSEHFRSSEKWRDGRENEINNRAILIIILLLGF